MIGTYAAVVAVCVSSLAIGGAAVMLCGARRWSWISPAVGLGLVCAICWATVRMPGHGAISAVLIAALTIAAAVHLHGRLEGGGEALRSGAPVAIGALLAASLPFLAEGHFGILGTGFNPDMSQHLLATDRLAHGESSQLLVQGYPLGPHSVVVALSKGLGVGIVQGFSGLTMAAAIIAALTALAAVAPARPRDSGVPFMSIGHIRRTGSILAALVIGLPYLVASYYAQGAFKEVIQALLVLAFVLSLRESTRTWQHLTLRYVPAALLAIGSVYTYSFLGIIWLAAIAAIWAIAEYAWPERISPAGGTAAGAPHSGRRRRRLSTWGRAAVTGPAGRRALSLAGIVFLVGTLSELGRMIDFHSFETFDPNGPGLGNLFGQVSPFTALGIWPSGDFRLAPGDGAMPAVAYYLGAAFAALLLVYGLVRCVRRRETSLLAGVAAVVGLYAAARLGGTPYASAKALEIAAPLLTMAIVLGLAGAWPLYPAMRQKGARGAGTGAAALAVYLAAAGLCSLLAFANAPVGPTSYSPALTSLRPLLVSGSTLVLAPDSLLADEHGERYIAWELRGGHVCIERSSEAGRKPPVGVRFVVTEGPPARPPFSGFELRRVAAPYLLWERRRPALGSGPCPLIAVRQARAGA